MSDLYEWNQLKIYESIETVLQRKKNADASESKSPTVIDKVCLFKFFVVCKKHIPYSLPKNQQISVNWLLFLLAR